VQSMCAVQFAAPYVGVYQAASRLLGARARSVVSKKAIVSADIHPTVTPFDTQVTIKAAR